MTVRAEPGQWLARRGADLWYELGLTVPDAVLGTTATVPGPEGEVTVTVPAGAQPGAVIQVAGQGFPRYREPGRGSLNVLIVIHIPQALSLRHADSTSDYASKMPGRR